MLAAVVIGPQVGWVCSRSDGTLPFGAMLPAKQFRGCPESKTIWPKSELLGFPNEPSWEKVLCSRASPSGSYTHPRPEEGTPPVAVQPWPSDGVPESGYGTIRNPQASLSEKVLSITVSLRPPDRVIPVPMGPAAASPASGTLGLLLSCE